MSFSENRFTADDLTVIINRIKNGEKDLFVFLADRYRDRIISVAYSFGLQESEREDLVQEGYIALYSAACSFDDTKGASFTTFATLCIKHRMLNWVEKNITNTGIAFPLSSLSDAELSKISVVEDSLEDNIMLRAEVDDLLSLADLLLSDKEKSVFSYHIKGYTSDEICNLLNITKKSCDNALFRIRKKLRSARKK